MKTSDPTVMRSIIISSYDDIDNPYYGGGGARAIYEVAKRLSSKYKLTVITANYPHATNKIVNGISYKRIGPAFVGPRLGQLVFHCLLPLYIWRMPFDVWVESLTPPFSTSFLQRCTRKPVIGLVHMLAAEDMERKYKLPFHIIENIGLKTYKYFIATTETIVTKLAANGHNPQTFMIPNGVIMPSQRQQATSPSEPYILFIGRIEVDQKGLDLLVHAYASIAAKSNVRLVIAGTGIASEINKLKIRIAAHGLAKKIQLVGRIEGERKQSLLENCSLVVMPSRLETFGMVALEAMSYGKPLVTFAIEGLAWIPEHCVIQAAAFDYADLARTMQRVLDTPTLAQQMSKTSVIEAAVYSWDAIAERYSEAFTTVLNAHGVTKK
jgi:glycosyltransferase involved in cell wall biosynthesis